MSRKVETIGCATPLRDVPGAEAAGFAALLGVRILSASCEEGCLEELDADGSLAKSNFLNLFGGEACLSILDSEASTGLSLFSITRFAALLGVDMAPSVDMAPKEDKLSKRLTKCAC